MSLKSAYSGGGDFGDTRWLASEETIAENDRYVVRISNIRNVDTRFNGPGWACYADDPDGRSVKIENPWIRTNRDGVETELHFVFLGLLRAALKVPTNDRLPPLQDLASGLDDPCPTLTEAACKGHLRGKWIQIQASRVRQGTQGGQFVDWRVLGPAQAPMQEESGEDGVPFEDDDDLPF